MSKTYDLRELASHYLSLNSAWENYSSKNLITPYVSYNTWRVEYHLRPGGIGTVKDDTVERERTSMIMYYFEEFWDQPEVMFGINKAIYDKLKAYILFDLDDEHDTFGIYEDKNV